MAGLSKGNPITDLTGWVWHRLTANYWSLALCAVITAPLFFVGTLALDRDGVTAWLLDNDLSPVTTSDTAKDVAGVVAGIDAAFLTLFFSISLLVLTIAAGNLGVRLIDRWLAKRMVRVSIAGLAFTLIYAVLTMAAIDAEAELSDTPLLCFIVSIAFLLVNIAMLAVATHDLGRTMFVDQAIDALAKDATDPQIEVAGVAGFDGTFAQTVSSPRNGYVEGVDLARLQKQLADHHGTVRICVAPGQHVFANQPLMLLEHQHADPGEFTSAIPIGAFRSNSEGAVFQIRLLVEIAARAMSPAINDFWTALVTADALGEVMKGHRANWVDDGLMPASVKSPSFELPGQDFRGLFAAPLAAFRQAAANYPSVTIRMIGNIERLMQQFRDEGCPDGLVTFLCEYATQLADHASQRADAEVDMHDIAKALGRVHRAAGSHNAT